MIQIAVRKRLYNAGGDFSLDIAARIGDGRFVAVFGDSGAGKTTLLRMLGGLSAPEEGMIEVDGEVWFDGRAGVNRPAQRRPIGFVFQDYSLFPHMTVRENLEYALGKNRDGRIIDELLDFAELGALARRKPDTLSGGQQQRVALIRAIVRRPRVLLLDEPLSALDIRMRERLQELIRNMARHFRLTTLMVTHEMSEAFNLADEVMVLARGRIVRRGPADEVFLHKKMSGKFRCSGEVIGINKADIVRIVFVRAGSQVVRVVASDEEVAGISVGDRVLVVSKAFNPVLLKIGAAGDATDRCRS